MPGLTFEEMQQKYPPADREEYDRAHATAELAGAMAELVYGMRTQAGFTQTELAARMGTTQSSVARMESGASLPTVEMLARLAHATGVPMRIAAPGVADVEILAPRQSRAKRRAERRPAQARSRSSATREEIRALPSRNASVPDAAE